MDLADSQTSGTEAVDKRMSRKRGRAYPLQPRSRSLSPGGVAISPQYVTPRRRELGDCGYTRENRTTPSGSTLSKPWIFKCASRGKTNHSSRNACTGSSGGCSQRGNEHRNRRRQDQQQANNEVNQRIMCIQDERRFLHQPCQSVGSAQCQTDAKEHAAANLLYARTQYKADDLRPHGTERHANSELFRSAACRQRGHAVNANHRWRDGCPKNRTISAIAKNTETYRSINAFRVTSSPTSKLPELWRTSAIPRATSG